ncbi:DUF6817 domain-containing protein [Kitasatospora viridis]|uniref:DUF6817 domain-containing protein n=1 Tax=Kitasatospora viridis TaxID=281105 RepID=UPI001FE74FF7|nr:hypothetical protein [Kitasatospora viridis]
MAALPLADALLRSLGAAELDHPGGTLLAHLHRVRELLADWGARPDLQLAGLCHACYGTDGFATALLPPDRRAELAAAIGPAAEAIVHAYASCERAPTYRSLTAVPPLFHDRFAGRTYGPTPEQQRDFAELTAANELDLVRQDPEFRARYGPALLGLFTRFEPLLSAPARRTVAELLG